MCPSIAQAVVNFNNADFTNLSAFVLSGGTYTATFDVTLAGNKGAEGQVEVTYGGDFNRTPVLGLSGAGGLLLELRESGTPGNTDQGTALIDYSITNIEPGYLVGGLSLTSQDFINATDSIDVSYVGTSATAEDDNVGLPNGLILLLGASPTPFSSGGTLNFDDANFDHVSGFTPGSHSVLWSVDVTGGTALTVDYTSATVQNLGTDSSVLDVELVAIGSITGTVFVDVGTKANKGPEDTNTLTGVTIELLDGVGSVIATNMTDATGVYSFTNLPVGNYTVREIDPTGYVSTTDTDGMNDNEVSVTVSIASIEQADFWDAVQTTYVLVSDFAGSWKDGEAVLRWETVAEVGTIGFFLFRSDQKDGEYLPVVKGLIPGLVTSPQGGVYHLVDPSVEAGSTGYYRLVEVDANGRRSEHGPYEVRFKSSEAKAVVREKKSREKNAVVSHAHETTSRERHERSEASKSRAARGKDIGITNQGPLRIVIGTSGLQKINLDEVASVASKKLKKQIQQGRVRLTHRGLSVAHHRVENELWFYAAALDDPYTDQDIFWLEPNREGVMMQVVDAGAPAAVGELRTFRQVTTVEEERASIIELFSDMNADYWYWDYILAGNVAHGTKSFSLPTPGAQDGSAYLVVNLHGYTDLAADPEHHAVVSLNGTNLGELIWDGSIPQHLRVDLPDGLLMDGTNTVEITGLLDEGVPYGSFAVDGFEVSYPRRYEPVEGMLMLRAAVDEVITVKALDSPNVVVFDLSELNRPEILENVNVESVGESWQASFFGVKGRVYYLIDRSVIRSPELEVASAKGRLRSHRNKADYLIVVPPGLEEGAQALAEYRQAQGLDVMTVELREIYDVFNHGLSAPTAIREFLTFAYERWMVSPHYVVFAGSGTYDYKDYMGLGENLIPPLMVETPYGIFASDTALADVNGDGRAEMSVGRLPVLSNEELLAYLTKIQAYETSTEAWKEQVTLVADNGDDGGDFHGSSEILAGVVGAENGVEKIYLGELSIGSAKQKLLEAFAKGSGLINYVGHGGTDRMASEGLLLKTDVSEMSNGDRPGVLVALTCSLGRFELPGFNSLGEDLVLHAGGGAVAVWAPSGLSVNHRVLDLGEAFFKVLYQDGEVVLGDAILQAGKSYEHKSWLNSLYNLIGDPALRLTSGAQEAIRRDQERTSSSRNIQKGNIPGSEKESIGENGEVFSSATQEAAFVPMVDSVLWYAEELESGMYLWKTESPDEVDILVNRTPIPAISLPEGIGWYLAGEGVDVMAVETATPTRMESREAKPHDSGEAVFVMADSSGMTELQIDEADQRIFVWGFEELPLVMDVSDAEHPVEVLTAWLGNRRGQYALYLSPGVSQLLVVEPKAIRVLEQTN